MRLIDADNITGAKFHSLPYTHIVPRDVEAESYMLGWNDAIDAIVEVEPTIEPERKKGEWNKISPAGIYECSECGKNVMTADIEAYDFCHGCGAKMEVSHDE